LKLKYFSHYKKNNKNPKQKQKSKQKTLLLRTSIKTRKNKQSNHFNQKQNQPTKNLFKAFSGQVVYTTGEKKLFFIKETEKI